MASLMLHPGLLWLRPPNIAFIFDYFNPNIAHNILARRPQSAA
jgi:hypothetical protein